MLWGCCRKFPELRFALSEGGIGWIPYFLERIDYIYRRTRLGPGMDFGGKETSKLFRGHFLMCFIDDPSVSRAVSAWASSASRGSATIRTPTARGLTGRRCS